MTKTTIGYIVVDGQITKGRSTSNNLFTGGVLIPEKTMPGIVYTKLKEDSAITGVENEDDLTQTFKSLYEIAFEKGTCPKYVKMQEMARARFDSGQWWDLEEVMDLRSEVMGNNSKHDASLDNTPTTPMKEGLLVHDKKSMLVHDKTDIGAELTLTEGSELSRINIKFCNEAGEDITIVIKGDNLQESGIQEDSCGAVKALVKLVPKLVEANTDLKNAIIEERSKTISKTEDMFKCSLPIPSSLQTRQKYPL